MSQLEILCCSCGIASVRRDALPRGYGDLYLGQDCIKLSHCDQPVLIVLSYMYINEWSVLFCHFPHFEAGFKIYNIDFPWE